MGYAPPFPAPLGAPRWKWKGGCRGPQEELERGVASDEGHSELVGVSVKAGAEGRRSRQLALAAQHLPPPPVPACSVGCCIHGRKLPLWGRGPRLTDL